MGGSTWGQPVVVCGLTTSREASRSRLIWRATREQRNLWDRTFPNLKAWTEATTCPATRRYESGMYATLAARRVA